MSSPWIIGIDEVGRGPLAGPVAVGALAARPHIIRRFREIKESKQLSPRARDAWAARIKAEEGEGLHFAIAFVSASVIDRIGINPAIARALAQALKRLPIAPSDAWVLLDGGLHAPLQYRHQKTIIRGDASETVIAMASVIAKVTRDARMAQLGLRYPEYGFERNAGYGTLFHQTAVRTHGPSPVHRRTFLRSLLPMV